MFILECDCFGLLYELLLLDVHFLGLRFLFSLLHIFDHLFLVLWWFCLTVIHVEFYRRIASKHRGIRFYLKFFHFFLFETFLFWSDDYVIPWLWWYLVQFTYRLTIKELILIDGKPFFCSIIKVIFFQKLRSNNCFFLVKRYLYFLLDRFLRLWFYCFLISRNFFFCHYFNLFNKL